MSVKTALIAANEFLTQQNAKAAEEVLFNEIMALRRVANRGRVIDYAEEGHDVIKDYLVAASKGLNVGIPFGWPSADFDSMGMQPGDFIAFLGRPGKGKTYMLLYLMLNAWRHKYSPLFISMEMNPQLIIQRMAALDTHTAATQIKMGQVSGVKKKKR